MTAFVVVGIIVVTLVVTYHVYQRNQRRSRAYGLIDLVRESYGREITAGQGGNNSQRTESFLAVLTAATEVRYAPRVSLDRLEQSAAVLFDYWNHHQIDVDGILAEASFSDGMSDGFVLRVDEPRFVPGPFSVIIFDGSDKCTWMDNKPMMGVRRVSSTSLMASNLTGHRVKVHHRSNSSSITDMGLRLSKQELDAAIGEIQRRTVEDGGFVLKP